MSKIGKAPIDIPAGVSVDMTDSQVRIKGPKGELMFPFPDTIDFKSVDGKVLLEAKNNAKYTRSMHGTIRMLIANAVHGVTEGWSKQLELVGTGYRARIDGKNLELTVGFSHPVIVEPKADISFKVEKTIITVEGINKELVGQTAAEIRIVRPPEPYKGKGIRYKGEEVRRKAGKAAKAAGAA